MLKETITVFRAGTTKTAVQEERNNKQAILKHFPSFIDCITETIHK